MPKINKADREGLIEHVNSDGVKRWEFWLKGHSFPAKIYMFSAACRIVYGSERRNSAPNLMDASVVALEMMERIGPLIYDPDFYPLL